MIINKKSLNRNIWYEDEFGDIIADDTDDYYGIPVGAYSYHTCFPLTITEEISYINSDGEYSAPVYFHTHIGKGNEAIILAMVNSGDYTLSEALMLYARSCERCENVLAYKYLNGEDGYKEFSDDWKNCRTRCEFCEMYDEYGEWE